jgi:DNA polymerase III epsilon subunit-like protein
MRLCVVRALQLSALHTVQYVCVMCAALSHFDSVKDGPGGRNLRGAYWSPLTVSETKRVAEHVGGSVFFDGLWGLTMHNLQHFMLFCQDPYTRRGVLTAAGISARYAVVPQGDADAASLSNLSGVPNLQLQDAKSFPAVFASNVTRVVTPAHLTRLYAALDASLDQAPLPELRIDGSAMVLSDVSFVALNMFRRAYVCGLRPDFYFLDNEYALWRSLRLFLHEVLACGYSTFCENLHRSLIEIHDDLIVRELVPTSSRPVGPTLPVDTASSIDTDSLLRFSGLARSPLRDGRTEASVSKKFCESSSMSGQAECKPEVATICRSIFTEEFVKCSLAHRHVTSRRTLLEEACILLLYDLNRIWECVHDSKLTLPVGLLMEGMDDIAERWQCIALPGSPLGRFLREHAYARGALCLFHMRMCISRKIKACILPVFSMSPASLAVDLTNTARDTAAEPDSAIMSVSHQSAAASTAGMNLAIDDSGIRDVAMDHSSAAAAASAASNSVETAHTTPDDIMGDAAASCTSSDTIGAASAILDVSGPAAGTVSDLWDDLSPALSANLAAAMKQRAPWLPESASNFLENIRCELRRCSSSVQHTVLSAVVQLKCIDAICKPTRAEFIEAGRSLLSSLQNAWPEMHDYCRDQIFSPAVRSVVGLSWRNNSHSSNANVIPEAANSTLKVHHFHSYRSHDPGAPALHTVGQPHSDQSVQMSFANECYRRNMILRQQKGAGDAAQRFLRVVHQAAVIVAKAELRLDGTSIDLIEPEKSAGVLGYEKILLITHHDTKRICDAYQSATLLPIDKKRSARAELTGVLLPKVPDELAQTTSITALNYLQERRKEQDKRINDGAIRTAFRVNISRDFCLHCGLNSRSCPHYLGGAVWAQDHLLQPPTLLADRFRVELVRRCATELITFHRRRLMTSPGESFMSRLISATIAPRRAVTVARKQVQSNVAVTVLDSISQSISQYRNLLHSGSITLSQPTLHRLQLLSQDMQHALTMHSSVVASSSLLAATGSHGPLPLLSAARAPPTYKIVPKPKHKLRAMGSTVTAPLHSTEQLESSILAPKVPRRFRPANTIEATVIHRPAPIDAARSFDGSAAASSALHDVVVCLDIETTQLNIHSSRIVEIAAAMCSPERREFSRLVNPGISIPYQATQVHGIRTEDVSSASVFGDVWKDFVAWLEKSRVVDPVILTYNGFKYDLRIIAAELLLANLAVPSSWRFSDLYSHVRGFHGFAPVFPATSEIATGAVVDVVDALSTGIEPAKKGRYRLEAVHGRVLKSALPDSHTALGDARGLLALYDEAVRCGQLRKVDISSVDSSLSLVLKSFEDAIAPAAKKAGAVIAVPAKRRRSSGCRKDLSSQVPSDACEVLDTSKTLDSAARMEDRSSHQIVGKPRKKKQNQRRLGDATDTDTASAVAAVSMT